MSDKCYLDVFATDGETAAAWWAFGEWLQAHRAANEDDERNDLELIDVYYEECCRDHPRSRLPLPPLLSPP